MRAANSIPKSSELIFISVVVVVVVVSIPLAGAASITNEDRIGRTRPAELQTSGFAALLAVVDRGTRQSQ